MLQMLGSLMILLGTMGIGYSYIQKEEKIISVIENWEHIMQMFISEITYKKQPLAFACYEIGEKVGKEEGRCLKTVADRMQSKNRESFWIVWEEECRRYSKREKLTEEMKVNLREFGVLTGFEDEEIQKRMIEVQGEKWKSLRIRKQKEHRERKRLIWILSSCMGIMLILVLW
ncbi:MAG: stage III sporulation protein AB [Lachnospiraceae bacterium]|nr:stage III sporulation protein AB [Lachnospiraceae bacterium]